MIDLEAMLFGLKCRFAFQKIFCLLVARENSPSTTRFADTTRSSAHFLALLAFRCKRICEAGSYAVSEERPALVAEGILRASWGNSPNARAESVHLARDALDEATAGRRRILFPSYFR